MPSRSEEAAIALDVSGDDDSRRGLLAAVMVFASKRPRRCERSRADDQYFATPGAGAPPIQVIVDADADDVTVEAGRRRQRGGIERRINGDGLIAAEPTPCVKFR